MSTMWTTYSGTVTCSACLRDAMSTRRPIATHLATWTRLDRGIREFACDAHKGVKTK